jgi:BirA family biotin operon repressor/biotin-[acetyl-CoA-carboxylase] ligase
MGQGFDRHRFLAAIQVVQQASAGAAIAELEKRLQIFDQVESTNQVAWESMTDGTLGPLVVALQQSAGRGQWGRQWDSQPGGLYLSVGLNLALPATQAAQLTLCTVWGIAIALRLIPPILSGVTTEIPVQIKWLNDLVLHGRKLGGILTETRIQQEEITKAVIGVGLNWTNPVPPTGINLQTFLAHHPDPLIESLEMLAAIVLHGLLTGIQQQQAGEMEQILREYLSLLAHRERPVEWNGKSWAIVGIAPTGELRVQPKLAEIAEQSRNDWNSSMEVLMQPGTISLGYPL